MPIALEGKMRSYRVAIRTQNITFSRGLLQQSSHIERTDQFCYTFRLSALPSFASVQLVQSSVLYGTGWHHRTETATLVEIQYQFKLLICVFFCTSLHIRHQTPPRVQGKRMYEYRNSVLPSLILVSSCIGLGTSCG